MPATLPPSSASQRLRGEQIELPLNAKPGPAHPLMDPAAAVVLLRLRNMDELLARVDGDHESPLEWVWDIGLGDRREVRIFFRCLPETIGGPVPDAALREAAVYHEVVPSHWGTISAARLRERCMCSKAHMTDLIAAGCFRESKEASRGPDGSAELIRDSVIEFLKARRIGAANINHERKAPNEI